MGIQHGAWCNARTVSMICRYCHQEVFYFFCDCGCKVFFDSLGEPWPKHYCAEYENSRPRIGPWRPQVTLEKKSFSWTLIGPDEKIDIEIDLSYSMKVTTNVATVREKRYSIQRIDPSRNAYLTQTGIVREIIGPVDKENKFGIRLDSPFGYQLLGVFKENDFMQLTIHTTNLALDNPLSYTFLIDTDLFKKQRIRIGSHILTTLTAEGVKGNCYWYCRSIEGFDE